ncbi:MAG TPA: dipeptidase PepE [Pyrinomonadaceae bacterium]
MTTKRLLLISNSTLHGSGYLDHAESEIRDVLSSTRQVLFLPYALHDRDAYAAQAKKRLAQMGYDLVSVHVAADAVDAVENADAIFIGGGNTFRLLNSLYQFELIEPIRRRVHAGMIYIGSSAGSNVATPSIKTTNDMPIIEPPSFEALALVNFQINPHYLDPDSNSKHMGETREERLRQYLEENETPVVGLREGTMIRVDGEKAVLKGTTSARVFRRGLDPVEIVPGTDVNEFLVALG